MSRYIDADKLIAEIGRLTNQKKKQLERFSDEDYCCSVASSINCELSGNLEVLSIIKSLQQEQPGVDLVAELKRHLATTPKEQLEKEWKELEPWNNIGPTVQEFLYGKQPEVDLDKEIERFVSVKGLRTRVYIVKAVAHYFYDLGLNTRKE